MEKAPQIHQIDDQWAFLLGRFAFVQFPCWSGTIVYGIVQLLEYLCSNFQPISRSCIYFNFSAIDLRNPAIVSQNGAIIIKSHAKSVFKEQAMASPCMPPN